MATATSRLFWRATALSTRPPGCTWRGSRTWRLTLTAAQLSPRSFLSSLYRYVARFWGRQLLLALAAAHKYGLRLRTLSARQVHRAATQPLSNSAITLP